MRRILVGFVLLCGACAVPAVSVAGSFAAFAPAGPPGSAPDQSPLQDLILVQSTDYSGGQDNSSRGAPDPYQAPLPGVPGDAVGITPEMTATIVAAVDDVNRYCQRHYAPAYAIDCLAQGYLRVGRGLSYKGGYSAARSALIDAGTRLHELAMSHADKKMPAMQGPTGKGAPVASLIPVAQPEATFAAASLIVNGAQLTLLRSASGSEQRRAAYQNIAAVVGSSKVLLRSARRRRSRRRAT